MRKRVAIALGIIALMLVAALIVLLQMREHRRAAYCRELRALGHSLKAYALDDFDLKMLDENKCSPEDLNRLKEKVERLDRK